MIFGIGVDCVKVARIAHSMEKPRFAKWVFSQAEQDMLAELGEGEKANESAAANFAAKEAFLKAAGVGLGGFALSDMAALRHENGMPYYQLSGTAAEFCEKNGLKPHLSISHEDGLAVATALLEKV